MRKLLLLFIPLVFFYGCELLDDEDDADGSSNTSYNCNNDECFSADGGSGQYATLSDCLSVCGEDNNNGYNCINNDCFSQEGGQYATLDDCLSACSDGITLDSPITICAEININSPIDLRVQWNTLDINEYFYLTGESTSSLLNPNCDEQVVSGFFGLPQFEWELSASKYYTFSTGNSSYFSELAELDFITGCIDVQVQIYGDNALVDDRVFQLGCSDWNYTETDLNNGSNYSLGNCAIFCSPYGSDYNGITDFSE
tara:strand:+ start:994 stop:1761 length:768 start_codon:yes stop_codon:yes gene_type:complete